MSNSISREQVYTLIQAHLADELDIEPQSILESTRFKEDLEADSLDLYTLVQESRTPTECTCPTIRPLRS